MKVPRCGGVCAAGWMSAWLAMAGAGCRPSSREPEPGPRGSAAPSLAAPAEVTEGGGAPLYSRSFAGGEAGLTWTEPGVVPEVVGLAADAAGNVFLAGHFRGTLALGPALLTSRGNWDVFVAKLDASGCPLWSKRFGDAEEQLANSIVVDAGGNAFVLGSFAGNLDFGAGPSAGEGWAGFLTKLDPTGSPLWSQAFTPTANTDMLDLYHIAVTPAGGVVAGGYLDGGGVRVGEVHVGGTGSFAIGFDADGVARWGNRFGGGSDAMLVGVAVDRAGNTVLAEAWSTGSRMFVTKLDPSGALSWRNRFMGDTSQDIAVDDVAVDAQGDILVAGAGNLDVDIAPPPATLVNGFIMRLDPAGAPRWIRPKPAGTGCGSLDRCRIAVDSGGGIVLSGSNAEGVFAARLSPEADPIWTRTFPAHASAGGMALGPDDEILAGGTFHGLLDVGLGPLSSGERTDVFVFGLTP